MTVHDISLDFFRSYVHGEAQFHPGVNVIAGENAQGKTNLLEAIAYLSPGGGSSPWRRTFTGMPGGSCASTGYA